MFKKIGLIVFFLSIAILSQSEAPEISVSPLQHDFGYVIQGTATSYTCIIFNKGTDTLNITDVRPSCGCTRVLLSDEYILPNDSTSLRVTFNSNGFSGQVQKSVYILSNDPKNQSIEIKYVADVVKKFPPNADSMSYPAIKFDEMSYDFGEIEEGRIVTHKFKFINSGHTDLKIGDIETSCGCTAALADNKVISPGDSGVIRVEFDSHYKHGQLTRFIYIKTNDPNNKSIALRIFADVEKGS
jgi:hypothetical protein